MCMPKCKGRKSIYGLFCTLRCCAIANVAKATSKSKLMIRLITLYNAKNTILLYGK